MRPGPCRGVFGARCKLERAVDQRGRRASGALLQRMPQRCSDAIECITRGAQHPVEVEESVKLARVVQQFDRDTSVAQALGIGQAVIADRIEARCQHQRRRKIPQVCAKARRDPGIGQVRVCLGDHRLDGVHAVRRQQVSACVLRLGRKVVAQVGGRIDQHLQPQRRPSAVDSALRNGRGEIASCRIAAHRQARLIDTVCMALAGSPVQHGHAVFATGIEVVLRCQAVARSDHHRTAGRCEMPADRVGAREPAHEEAAAVEPQEGRCQFRVRRRAVQPQLDGCLGPGNLQRFDAGHIGTAAKCLRRQAPGQTLATQGSTGDRLAFRQADHLQKRPCLGIKALAARLLRPAGLDFLGTRHPRGMAIAAALGHGSRMSVVPARAGCAAKPLLKLPANLTPVVGAEIVGSDGIASPRLPAPGLRGPRFFPCG